MEGSRHFVTKAGHIPQPSLPLSLSLLLPPFMGKSNRWFRPVGKAVWSGGGLYHSLFGVCVCFRMKLQCLVKESHSHYHINSGNKPQLHPHRPPIWRALGNQKSPPFLQIHSHVHTHSDTHIHTLSICFIFTPTSGFNTAIPPAKPNTHTHMHVQTQRGITPKPLFNK